MKFRAILLYSSLLSLSTGTAFAVAQVIATEPERSPTQSPESGTPPAQADASTKPDKGSAAYTQGDSGFTPDSTGNESQGNGATDGKGLEQAEDGAIETPPTSRIEWVPPEDANSGSTPAPAVKRAHRPRKVLSDITDGNAGWTMPGGQNQPYQGDGLTLSERAPQRERPIDPQKRSDLSGLARTLGSLHALRVACGGRDDQTWRSRMATMLDMEAPSGGQLRDPLVDAFNGGFQTYGRGAGPCPIDARAAEAHLAKQGRGFALAMAVRYRPNQPAKTPAQQTESDRSDRPAGAAIAVPTTKPAALRTPASATNTGQ